MLHRYAAADQELLIQRSNFVEPSAYFKRLRQHLQVGPDCLERYRNWDVCRKGTDLGRRRCLMMGGTLIFGPHCS